MEIYRTLNIEGERSLLITLLDNIKQCTLPDAWSYPEKESKWYAMTNAEAASDVLVLRYSHDGGQVQFFLKTNEIHHAIQLVNIVPVNSGSLSIEEYNRLVTALDRFIEPYTKGLGVKLRLSNHKPSPSELMTEKMLEAFNRWKNSVNLSSPFGHPVDIDNWDDFTIAASEATRRLPSDLLVKILEEAVNLENSNDYWRLIQRYESGLDVLRRYKSRSVA